MENQSSRQGSSYSFKVVLLGEGAVGKTSLVLRYVENKFNDKHITTLQVCVFLNFFSCTHQFHRMNIIMQAQQPNSNLCITIMSRAWSNTIYQSHNGHISATECLGKNARSSRLHLVRSERGIHSCGLTLKSTLWKAKLSLTRQRPTVNYYLLGHGSKVYG